MTVALVPNLPLQFLLPAGLSPAAGAKLFFYTSGTTTKTAPFADSLGLSPLSNPIILDSGGNIPAGGEVWVSNTAACKVVFAPPTDTDPPVSPYWTRDNLPTLAAGGGGGGGGATGAEWITYSGTPTYISAKSFYLATDLTAIFLPSMRVKVTQPSGATYGTITSAVYDGFSSTTITLAMDYSGVAGVSTAEKIYSSLTAVAYSALSSAGTSQPIFYGTVVGTSYGATYTVAISGTSLAPGSLITFTTDLANTTNSPTLTFSGASLTVPISAKGQAVGTVGIGDLNGTHTLLWTGTGAILLNPNYARPVADSVTLAVGTTATNLYSVPLQYLTAPQCAYDMLIIRVDSYSQANYSVPVGPSQSWTVQLVSSAGGGNGAGYGASIEVGNLGPFFVFGSGAPTNVISDGVSLITVLPLLSYTSNNYMISSPAKILSGIAAQASLTILAGVLLRDTVLQLPTGYSGRWEFFNATTGNYRLVIGNVGQSTSTYIWLPQGYSTVILGNGTVLVSGTLLAVSTTKLAIGQATSIVNHAVNR